MKNYLISFIFFIISFNSFCTDVYNSSNQQLTIPAVNVNDTIYTNVVVTVGSVVSIGGAINARTSTTFPVQQALKNIYTNGTSLKLFKISGTNQSIYANGSTSVSTLSGNASMALLPQISATFKGTTSLAIPFNQSITSIISTYQNTSYPGSTGSGSDTIFVNSNYQPVGYQYYQGLYCEAVTPGTYPIKVVIGQMGFIATYNCWSNGNKSTPDWSIIETYETTPDINGNMIFKINKNTYYSGDNTLTNQDSLSFTITTNGLATILNWSTSNIVTQAGCTQHPTTTCGITEISLN